MGRTWDVKILDRSEKKLAEVTAQMAQMAKGLVVSRKALRRLKIHLRNGCGHW